MSLRHHRYSQVTGIPCAMVLTVSFALFPVTGLSCHRRQQIIPPTWHQHRGARTTRLRRPRDAVRLFRRPASIASHTQRSWRSRSAPRASTGSNRSIAVSTKTKSKIFLLAGLDWWHQP